MRRALWSFSLLFTVSTLLAAQCPTETNTHWAQYSTVYFSLGNIDPNSTEGKQIVAASIAWNQADVNNNNSGVLFYQANSNNPAVLTFNNGPTPTGDAGVRPVAVMAAIPMKLAPHLLDDLQPATPHRNPPLT